MKNLKTYLTNTTNPDVWDGHIHLFDHNGVIDKFLIKDYKCVCFADIVFRYKEQYDDGKMIEYYDDFITNHYDSSKHILMATSNNADDVISIYKKYPNIIKGFGEFKCYDKWKEGQLPYGNLEWIRPVLEFNKTLNMPIYIHFNLDTHKHREELDKTLTEFCNMPIVLCHCGMVDDEDMNLDIHMFVRELMLKHNNLYVDLSTHKTRNFYIKNVNCLYQLSANRIIVGSDINPIVKDVIKDPETFVNMCYDEVMTLNTIGSFNQPIYDLFNITNDKCDRLIELYKQNFSTLSRHCKIHLLTRGNLVNMFPKHLSIRYLKRNSKTLDEVLNLFDNDIDTLIDKYVLIGYRENKRKRKIGQLFKSVNTNYKRFLGLITIMEMTYTFQRMGLMELIDIDRIESVIIDNIDLISECMTNDEYNFRDVAATKYINASYFIMNLTKSFPSLNNILDVDFCKSLVNEYVNKCKKDPNETTMYGMTHILIGASNFYTKQLPSIYNPIINELYNIVFNNRVFDSFTLDLRMELVLCCKLFGNDVNIDLSNEITMNDLERNEHTNMLYILYNKYQIQ